LCSRFGTVSLKCRIASGNVMSSVPLGSTIRVSSGVSNHRIQPC
jgi:hypothetical protein